MEGETRRADVTTRALTAGRGELRERLLRLGFIKVDRKGFLKSDAYVAAAEIDRVHDGAVHLTVADREMLKEADT